MPISAKKMIKELEHAGYVKVSQNGSHVKLRNTNIGRVVIVPLHAGDLKKGLELAIRRKAGLNDEN